MLGDWGHFRILWHHIALGWHYNKGQVGLVVAGRDLLAGVRGAAANKQPFKMPKTVKTVGISISKIAYLKSPTSN